KINDLRKSQDIFNSTELKVVSKEKKSKDEIQRLKREQNKRHIEQAVKERQKANEFHDKEMNQLMESHDKLVEQLEDVKQKSVEELVQLFEKRCRHIRNGDLEILYATLYAEELEESKKYEEVYKEGVQEVASLRKDHEMRMNVLKLEQREEVIALIEKQLKEQHALAKESIQPEFDELRVVMELTKTKQSKKLAEVHERKINDLRKSQDIFNSTELKVVSKEKKSKDEIQRLKREQNKRHIEQAVKERQKANEFHDKEMKQLMESHDKLVEQLEDVKQKSVEELVQLFEKRCRHIRNGDLEILYATLYAEELEESKL
ncbi:1-phosphatidylinositol 4,5-bisphosphate phosphodiesterase classes I and II-like, partial [Paramuricea clavata]